MRGTATNLATRNTPTPMTNSHNRDLARRFITYLRPRCQERKCWSLDYDHGLTLANFTDEIGFHTRARSNLLDRRHRFRIDDAHHADPHVEYAVHLLIGHPAAFLEQFENRQYLPRTAANDRTTTLRQHPGNVVIKPATRYVRDPMNGVSNF